MTTRRLAALVPAALLASACASRAATDQVLFPVTDAPAPVRGIPAAEPAAAHADPIPEEQVRAWLDEHYGPRADAVPAGSPVPAAVPARRIRYVPARQPVRERVIYVDRDRSDWSWWPAVSLGFGWWGGRHHGHHGWNWGLGWSNWGRCR